MAWDWMWVGHEARRCVLDAGFVLNVNDWAEFLVKSHILGLGCGPGRIRIDLDDDSPGGDLDRARPGSLELGGRRYGFHVVRQIQWHSGAPRRRWWFLCSRCGERAAKVYLVEPGGTLACRGCCRLRYPSENLTRGKRTHYRSGAWRTLAREVQDSRQLAYRDRSALFRRLRRGRRLS